MASSTDQSPEPPPERPSMLGGPDPIVVQPREGSSMVDPSKRGIITIRELTDNKYERMVTFPDGSFEAMHFGDWRDLMASPEPVPAAKAGGDAAARRLAAACVGKLLYDHALQGWFVWDGTVWRRDRTGLVMRMIRDMLRKTRQELDDDESDDDERDASIVDPAPRLVAATEKFARTEAALTADPAAWDADICRLGTPGGTVDLATGVLHPADPAERITRATAVAPAATADCPLWRRFIAETTGGDVALAGFLQRFLGYTLTGETSEHVLLYGVGEGGNGKSVFLNTVRGIFGDYAAVATPDLLTHDGARQGKAHAPEIAMLAGARLVTASETEEGRAFADGRLKLLTGGDPVTARFLRRDHFTFTPRFKLFAIGNHMPLLRTVDAAMQRRLCVIPFVAKPSKPDRHLEAKLKTEWPAILRWMIDGCLAWRAEGLERPVCVTLASAAYLAGQDMVGQFLAEACKKGPDEVETAAAFFAAWCAYAKAAGEPPGTQRRFAARAGAPRPHPRADAPHAVLPRCARAAGLREGAVTSRARPVGATALSTQARTECANQRNLKLFQFQESEDPKCFALCVHGRSPHSGRRADVRHKRESPARADASRKPRARSPQSAFKLQRRPMPTLRSILLQSSALLSMGAVSSAFGWAALTSQAIAQSQTVVLEQITVDGRGRGTGEGRQAPPTGTVGAPPPAYPGGQVGSGARLGVLGNRNVFNTPFNITSYTAPLIRNQQARDVIDVIENDPSVRASGSLSEAVGENVYIRGFPLFNLDYGFDGLFGITDQRRPLVYNIERVEVLKGPNALINGAAPNGGVGGSINFIPKRAGDEPLTRITPFFVSRGQFGTAVDIGRRYGKNGEWGIRFNGAYQGGRTAVDKERISMGFVSLGIDYRYDRFRMSYDLAYQDTYFQQNRSFLFALPGIQIPRAPNLSTNLEQPGEYQRNTSLMHATRVEYDLAPTTTVFAGFGTQSTKEEAFVNFKFITDTAGNFSNTFVRQVDGYKTNTFDTGVRTQFETGPIRHRATMAGAGFFYEIRYPQAIQFLPSAGISNLYNPVRVPVTPLTDIPTGNALGNSQTNASVALVDTLSTLDDRIQLTLGGRVQQLTAQGYDFAPSSPTFGQRTSSYDQTTPSPAVALLVKPTERLSLYGNYVQALISPGAAPATSSNAGQVLAPIKAQQKEVGAKYDFGRLGTTVSFFEIMRPNAIQDPVTLRFSADGLQRNRGAEFNVFGEIVPSLRVLGGVAFMDGRLVRTAGGLFDGNEAPTVPRFSLNLYSEYDLPRWLVPNLTATGRVIYTSSQIYDQANLQKIPGWTRFDLGLRYTYLQASGKPIIFRANVLNVGGANYYASTGLGLLTLGTPRTYLLSAQVDL